MQVAFLALHGVLIDVEKLRAYYPDALGQIMVLTYGGSSSEWATAFKRVRADWDDYYDDLNLAGDEGIDDLWEGMIRTTRALFRLTGHIEPAPAALAVLARTLPGKACALIDVLCADVRPRLAALTAHGYALAAYGTLSAHHIDGMLIGGGVMPQFLGAIGIDTAERFDHDADYWRIAALRYGVDPSACVVIDPRANVIANARSIGMRSL